MPTPYDIPPKIFTDRLAKYLKNNVDAVKPPEWASYVKTGVHSQRPPQNNEWWYIRSASLLRKVYIKGPIALVHLSSEYGGRKRFGVKPKHVRKGSRSIVRLALQQLQTAGLVNILKPRGRIVTPTGRKVLDVISSEIKKEMDKENPDFAKY